MKTYESPDKLIFYFDTTSLGVDARLGNGTVSSGLDDGTNDKMSMAIFGCHRHLTTDEAVENLYNSGPGYLEACVGPLPLILSGHGNEGLIETGAGQDGDFNRDNYVEFFNKDVWMPLFAKLAGHRARVLRLFSCHTGAGESGADLLFLIAKQTGKTVEARTGFTYAVSYTNGRVEIDFEVGSQWQAATPSNRPTPINAPNPHLMNKKIFNEIILFEENDKFSFNKTRDFQKAKMVIKHSNSEILEEIDTTFFLPFIFRSEPFKVEGTLQSIITGSLIFTINDKNYKFDVYNNRLLRARNTNFYYHTDKVLLEELFKNRR